MYSHVMLGATDIEASKKFYDATLGLLGAKPGLKNVMKGITRYMYFLDGMTFLITEPLDGNPASHGNGVTLGFKARDTKTIDEWHATGIENGGVTCEDPPGIREGGGIKAYLGYLRDPSGNKICTMIHLKKS
jgi:catechol 2,3-dioxygenase-like lactoylglutathione lyase family enzyme